MTERACVTSKGVQSGGTAWTALESGCSRPKSRLTHLDLWCLWLCALGSGPRCHLAGRAPPHRAVTGGRGGKGLVPPSTKCCLPQDSRLWAPLGDTCTSDSARPQRPCPGPPAYKWTTSSLAPIPCGEQASSLPVKASWGGLGRESTLSFILLMIKTWGLRDVM